MKNINIEELKKLINNGLKLNEISNELNVSVSTVKRLMSKYELKSLSLEIKRKESINELNCEKCGLKFKYKKYKRIRKFCSKKCSLLHNKIKLEENREKINEKISFKLRKIEKIGICLWCQKEFEKRNKNHRCCSRSCSSSEVNSRPEYKNKISEMFSELAKKRYESGDLSIGWKSRKKLEPSYPEKLTMNFLDSKEIGYEYELKCGRYFIDFAFKEKKIALEIDGRRHDDPEIIEKDIRKDKYLKNNGWIVHRIKWKNDKKHYDRLNSFIVQFGLE